MRPKFPFTRRIAASATLAATAFLHSGCASTERTMREFSAGSPPNQHPSMESTPRASALAHGRELDQHAATVAAAQAHLAFPARVGIARIEDGRVTHIPPAEWATWRTLREELGPGVAGFAPVSQLVAQSLTQGPISATPYDALANIRLAAARQHLDAVLVYELSLDTLRNDTEFSVLDVTIIGALFRTRRSHALAQAAAALIDVRSGLSYGSAVGHGADTRSAASLGSDERLYQQRMEVAEKAVVALAPEVEDLFHQLASAPAVARARPVDAAPFASADRTIPPPAASGDAFWSGR